MMENSSFITPQQPTRQKSKKPLVIVAVSILLIVVVAGVVLVSLYNQALHSAVKQQVDQVPQVMEKAIADGSGYPVEIAMLLPGDKSVRFEGGGSVDGVSYCVTGVSKKNDDVRYYVSSLDDETKEGDCNSLQDPPEPVAPSIPSPTAIGASSIGVTWPEVPYASSYTIQCSTDSKFREKITDAKVSTLSGVCEGLMPATAYYVRVRAENTVGSEWSPGLSAQTQVVSVAPSGLSIEPISASEVTYSWKAVEGATSYVVEWASDTSFLEGKQEVTVKATTGTIKNLKPSSVYYFHVKAITPEFDSNSASYSETVGTLTKRIQ